MMQKEKGRIGNVLREAEEAQIVLWQCKSNELEAFRIKVHNWYHMMPSLPGH